MLVASVTTIEDAVSRRKCYPWRVSRGSRQPTKRFSSIQTSPDRNRHAAEQDCRRRCYPKRAKRAFQMDDKFIPEGPFQTVTDAITALTDGDWHDLTRFATIMLFKAKRRPRMARYLAGVSGEDIIGATVLSLQNGAAHGNGRKTAARHLENRAAFLAHFRGATRSTVDNFRRHTPAQFEHVSLGETGSDSGASDPVAANDVARELILKDLVAVVLDGVFLDLKTKPKQRAILKRWAESLLHDDILPTAGHSKFLGHCVRSAIKRRLRDLATKEDGIQNPTGKEMLH